MKGFKASLQILLDDTSDMFEPKECIRHDD